jgi:hypothetical protein
VFSRSAVIAPCLFFMCFESEHGGSMRLYGLVLVIPGYRSRNPGFDSRATRFSG